MIKILPLLFVPFFCIAQEKEKADTASVKGKFTPTQVRIGTDVLALIKTSVDDTYSGWEVNTDVGIHRYFLTLDVGQWSRDFVTNDDQYSNDGQYFRVGVDVNFLQKNPNGNAVILGARYARSIFSEEYNVKGNDPVWGDIDEHYINSDISARWFELTGGLRVRVWKLLWLGYTARFKLGLSTDDTPDMIPYDIPGYGNNEKNSTWGFNYQVLIGIPVKKKK